MWNLQTCSKIIQKRSLDKNYQIHRSKLENMKPQMRIQNPYQPDFIYTKDKLNMSRKDRRKQIDRLNSILLGKMQAIKDAPYTVNKLRPQAQNLKTLNAHTMNVMTQQIATENQRFCKQLMKTKTFYPTGTILQKTDHLDYISQNISFNARRAMSARNLLTERSRPKSGYTTNYSMQKKKSVENFRSISSYEKRKKNLLRPETAPMHRHHSQKKIIVPQSGRPHITQRKQVQQQLNY